MQFTAWKCMQKIDPSHRDGLIPGLRASLYLDSTNLGYGSYRPYRTEPFFSGFPGSKLPGYLQLVPWDRAP